MADQVLRNFRRWCIYYLLRLILSLVRLMPIGLAADIGSVLGGLFFWVNGTERRRAIQHLTDVFGAERPPAEIRAMAQAVFRNFGRNALEYIHLPFLSRRRLARYVCRFEGRENIERALAAGRGIITVGAHVGSWELVGAYWASLGWEVVVVARRIYFEPYNRIVEQQRDAAGIRTIYQDQGVRPVLRALRNGALVGLLADQDMPKFPGVFVNVFGRPAYTPSGPFALALAGKVPLMSMFSAREARGHRICVSAPIQVQTTGDRQQDIQALAEKWTKHFEAFVRQYPEQWAWFHRRWKTRPAETATKTSDGPDTPADASETAGVTR